MVLTIYKYDLARIIGISQRALRDDLNRRFITIIEPLGYSRYCKRVDGKILDYIKSQYGIDEEVIEEYFNKM
ncbi:MAG: hypothetical protein WC451_05560 [Patescibacteria group bacterium]|jgi:hypothetical protein